MDLNDKFDLAHELIGHIRLWLEIREQEGYELPKTGSDFDMEADHSLRGGLLGWLVAGNKPLPNPPPVSFSRPWHDLVAKGRDEGFMDVYPMSPEQSQAYGLDRMLNLNQRLWVLEEEVAENHYVIVQRVKGVEAYVAKPEWGRWRLQLGKTPETHQHIEMKWWVLERIEADSG